MRPAGKAFFPLDKQLGLTRSAFSPELASQMVWIAGLLPYKQAEEIFERIGKRLVAATSIWEQVQRHGPRLQDYLKHQQDLVGVERVVLPGHDLDIRKGISMDGGMLHIRGEGWKEFKLGTVFDVELRLERDPETRELVEKPHGVNMTYAAALGTPAELAPAFWKIAVDHQVPQAFHSSVTADGAEWIWNLSTDLFPDSVQILDWYHATQHLALAASALYPDDKVQARRWFSRSCDDLYQGNTHRITLRLENADLPDHARYFHHHKRRMQYQTFSEEGYPIGSGTVESGIKQFKQRLTGPGMRWSRPGAVLMLIIRCAVLGYSFDDLWAAA